MMKSTTTPLPPLVLLQNVAKTFGGKTIVQGITLSVAPGQAVVMVGPSGGGKSTILRCVNGLNVPDAGTVLVEEHQVFPVSRGREGRAILRAARRKVGMIFQDYQLFPHLNAMENVALAPVHVLGWSRSRARERAREMLNRVGLSERETYYPQQLSGGQKQRVAIARALAMEPVVLLCDEITAALDPALKQEVLSTLEKLNQEGIGLLMVTHEIGFAQRAAHHVLVLAGGEIIEQGPPEQVLREPSHEQTKAFLKNVLD